MVTCLDANVTDPVSPGPRNGARFRDQVASLLTGTDLGSIVATFPGLTRNSDEFLAFLKKGLG